MIQASPTCDVGKCAITIVVIQRVMMHPAYKDVFIPVVVVVADCNAIVVAATCKTGLGCNVGEMTVPVILKKTVEKLRGRLVQRSDVGSVREEDVELAIIVVIEEGHATRHGLRGIALRSFRAVELKINWLV